MLISLRHTEGNVPEALIGLPENWNPDHVRQFQAYWDSLESGDTAERRHAKRIPFNGSHRSITCKTKTSMTAINLGWACCENSG